MNAFRLSRRHFLSGARAAVAGLLLLGGRSSASIKNVKVTHSPAEWKRLLGPQRYHVLRKAGTEPAFTSPLLNEHRKGTFACAGCALPLFASSTKFESGTGWPSFWKPLAGAVSTKTDRSLLMQRTEVLCSRCGGHLGHVFDDGPKPTGLRYCMNGLALSFKPA